MFYQILLSMEKIISYIENVTKERNLSLFTWEELVDKIILPKMAGPKNEMQSRYKIGDMFMNLLAYFPQEISEKNIVLAPILFEIALQRLSCGAVLHDSTPWPEPLPEKYWEYSSKWDERHVMTEGCYNFIMNGLEQALKFDMTRDHALKILFGLMEYTDVTGNIYADFMLGDFKGKAAQLYRHAEKLVEGNASFEEIYPYYARVGQWEKHISYLSKNKDKINWDDFFEKTQAAKGNFISRRLQRNAIRKQIENAAL